MTHRFFITYSSCKITGNGKPEATIRIPLKGCGSLQVVRTMLRNLLEFTFDHL